MNLGEIIILWGYAAWIVLSLYLAFVVLPKRNREIKLMQLRVNLMAEMLMKQVEPPTRELAADMIAWEKWHVDSKRHIFPLHSSSEKEYMSWPAYKQFYYWRTYQKT